MKPLLSRLFSFGLAAVLALPVLGLSGCGGSEDPDAPPEPRVVDARLEFERKSEDFGVVYPGALRETTFRMRTAGSEPAVISEISYTCGCTDGKLFVLGEDGSRTELVFGTAVPPGTELELEARLMTKGRVGEQEQELRVIVDDQPKLFVFTLLADIQPFLKSEPPLLDLGRVSSLAGASGTAEVSVESGEPFVLGYVPRTFPEDLSLELTPIDPQDDGRAASWQVTARVRRGADSGKQNYKIIWTTDVENEQAQVQPDGSYETHRSQYYVTAEVEAIFDVRPSAVDFGDLSGESVTRSVRIEHRDPNFRLDFIEVGLFEATEEQQRFAHRDSIRVEARPIRRSKVWAVDLTSEGLPVKGRFSGYLVIKVDHPQQDVVLVPFIGNTL